MKRRVSGDTQPLLLCFIDSCIFPLFLYRSPPFFPGLLKEDYAILTRTLRIVNRTSGVLLKLLVKTVVNKHINSCEHLAGVILSDAQHSLHLKLSACRLSGKKKSKYIRLYAHTTKYNNSTIPYLARLLCSEESTRHELNNQLPFVKVN
ncbi:unnamed protein product [Heterobilharzia americana]|nr:unnamed protein product [Heterobilharzia americana]CAH8508443.1 unnamed protein product [Heterobilharzia americana]